MIACSKRSRIAARCSRRGEGGGRGASRLRGSDSCAIIAPPKPQTRPIGTRDHVRHGASQLCAISDALLIAHQPSTSPRSDRSTYSLTSCCATAISALTSSAVQTLLLLPHVVKRRKQTGSNISIPNTNIILPSDFCASSCGHRPTGTLTWVVRMSSNPASSR